MTFAEDMQTYNELDAKMRTVAKTCVETMIGAVSKKDVDNVEVTSVALAGDGSGVRIDYKRARNLREMVVPPLVFEGFYNSFEE